MREFLTLSDRDLRNNPFKYDEEQILYTLQNECPSLRVISRYQKLTAYMCAKYVIFGGNGEKYGDCEEDRYLSDGDILRRQPHLTQHEISLMHGFVELEEESEEEELELMFKEDYNALNSF
jgi:hypothetical protein